MFMIILDFAASIYTVICCRLHRIFCGLENRIIGLLCINFYLNTPFINVIGSFTRPDESPHDFEQENFVDNIQELIHSSYDTIKLAVYADNTIPSSQKKKEIVARLHQKGIFKLKNAVMIVADLMGISKNTVYLHLRSVSAE